MDSVFLLWHTHRHTEIDYEDEKLIGVYRTRKNAEAAIERVKVKPGFNRSPEAFEISEYFLDQDNWTEGFGFE